MVDGFLKIAVGPTMRLALLQFLQKVYMGAVYWHCIVSWIMFEDEFLSP